jgi:LPXTG-motif cell wall-anchored protein
VTPTPTPTETPTPTPTATPNFCNGTCGSNYNCQGGYFCHDGYCRNPACQDDSSCGCGSTPTPTPTPPPVLGASAPPVLPKTGSDTAGIVIGLLGIAGTGVYLFKKFKLI